MVLPLTFFIKLSLIKSLGSLFKKIKKSLGSFEIKRAKPLLGANIP